MTQEGKAISERERICEACGGAVVEGLLCNRCAETIDRDTEAALERLHYDDSECE